jgi:hypothetical protein
MDILNFISWIRGKRQVTTVDPAKTLLPVGIKDPKRDDEYIAGAITVEDFAAQIGGGGGSHYIGELVGGGIVVALWKDGSTEKALIASLTNLSTGIEWTLPAFQSTLIGPAAQSFSNGLGNTNAIIAQTTAPAASTYAAGLARLHSGGGYNDWYLPALWELNMCYNSAAIVNKVLGTNSFIGTANYWSSTEKDDDFAYGFDFNSGNAYYTDKITTTFYVRAVRRFSIP